MTADIRVFDGKEVASHSSQDSCWIVLFGLVYDVTSFLKSHPGGAGIILRNAGRDATEEYDSVHPRELLDETLPSSSLLGRVDQSTLTCRTRQKVLVPEKVAELGLDDMISVEDFAKVAETKVNARTWAYFASAADDEISKIESRRAFQKVALRPRILRDVDVIDTTSTMLGFPSSFPVFVSPCGLNKLAHPTGECGITNAVGKAGLIQAVSTGASMSIESVMEARVSKEQPIFFQLYVNKDLSKTKDLIARVNRAGVSAIWITVDSPVLGKRERDDRLKAQEMPGGSVGSGKSSSAGIAKASSAWITSQLRWEDLDWIRELTDLPLVLKGIQTVEDAVMAYKSGMQGIVLSNHGGRSQDTSQPPMLTLLEIRKYAPWLIGSKMEIYLDGGITRGTDIVKAMALGATAVGLGRPFLHALAVGGSQGVQRLIEILHEEFRSNMALAGATKVSEIIPDMVNPSRLAKQLVGCVKL